MANTKFIVKNGVSVGTTDIINASGEWIGPNSGLVGATGSAGAAPLITVDSDTSGGAAGYTFTISGTIS